jgi:hypothetical protein
MTPRFATRITIFLKWLVRVLTIYKIDAVPTQVAIDHTGFSPWSLIYEDVNGDGKYTPHIDVTLSFSGTTYTMSTPNSVYSAPVLNSPVYDQYISPFTNGTGFTSSSGTYYPDNWQFTVRPTGPGQEGGVACEYFTYIQTPVSLLALASWACWG